MPSYNSFSATKDERDFLMSRNLPSSQGVIDMTIDDYGTNSFDISKAYVKDLPDVTENLDEILGNYKRRNTYAPDEFYLIENNTTIFPAEQLGLYPYFNVSDYNIIGIINGDDYGSESKLFENALKTLRDDKNGFIQQRNNQHEFFFTPKSGVNGVEPLKNLLNKVTVNKDGSYSNFNDIVLGRGSNIPNIPTYLDPLRQHNKRPKPETELGAIWQDVSGVLGEALGIQRRKGSNFNLSDHLLEYTGSASKNALYQTLKYSKYGPNYTTLAKTQHSSKLFGLFEEAYDETQDDAPYKYSYIGDDRSNSVENVLHDSEGRRVKSNYHLSFLFDELQTRHFENVDRRGDITGGFTWVSRRSRNELGLYNINWGSHETNHTPSLSTEYDFREDSILSQTQALLDSLPNDSFSARNHVANIIDQTSRFFKEGDKIYSKGSAVVYYDRDGRDVGAEFCRVWTKDRPYHSYYDAQKGPGNIRNFDASVMGGGSRPWNINVAPMSDGNGGFEGSTNIIKHGDGFVAKKYMFSLENLSWKNSYVPGYTYNDLPYAERGPNGGRVMWFPPYDLSVSESVSSTWEENKFIGRSEPVFTYNGTTRTSSIGFKLLVDHPSILNLLVREHFKGMSDAEADEYITSFFSGCLELDFYDLIRRYANLEPDDIKLIEQYLTEKADPEVIKKYKTGLLPAPEQPKESVSPTQSNVGKKGIVTVVYPNDFPKAGDKQYRSPLNYGEIYDFSLGKENEGYSIQAIKDLEDAFDKITTKRTNNNVTDFKTMFNGVDYKDLSPTELTEYKKNIVDLLKKEIDYGKQGFSDLSKQAKSVIEDIKSGSVQELKVMINSSCSAIADNSYNYRLSLRRTHSIITYFLKLISQDNGVEIPDKWINLPESVNDTVKHKVNYTFKELGFDKEGYIEFTTYSAGEKVNLSETVDCTSKNYHNVELRKCTPIAFRCRQSTVIVEYLKAEIKQDKQDNDSDDLDNSGSPADRTVLLPDGEVTVPSKHKKPNIDVMKRIIMKVLSEGYYFKKLEENDPISYHKDNKKSDIKKYIGLKNYL